MSTRKDVTNESVALAKRRVVCGPERKDSMREALPPAMWRAGEVLLQPFQ